jgi:uncharacterized protein (DUF433 family)
MSSLREFVAHLTPGEKAELLQVVVRELGQASPGIDVDPAVCGGEPRIIRTRIPVWLLVQARRLGSSEADLLSSYPSLMAEDLANAWAYARAHPEEIDRQIAENEAAWRMALLDANENFPLPAVEDLRQRGHDVLTSQQAGNAGRSVPDVDVLRFAIREARAVLTFNRRHFVKLHEQVPDHSGIVACSFDTDFAALGQRIDAAISSQSDLRGQLLRINRPG